MAFQAATGEAPSTTSSTSSTTLLLDGKSPTLALLARCGSRCSRSVRQLVERKLSPISTGLTFYPSNYRRVDTLDSWFPGIARRIKQVPARAQ